MLLEVVKIWTYFHKLELAVLLICKESDPFFANRPNAPWCLDLIAFLVVDELASFLYSMTVFHLICVEKDLE